MAIPKPALLTVPLKLSSHFSLAEAIVTNTGLPNTPTETELAVLGRTAMKMEEVRALLGDNPILVSSWFRSEEVNNAVGGVPNSQHRLGEAVDFTCPKYGSVSDICTVLLQNAEKLNFDQLIHEPSWVHISWLTNRKDPRKEPRHQYIDYSGR